MRMLGCGRMAAFLVAAATASVQAQVDPVGPEEQNPVCPGTFDTVTRQELREWAALFWEWQDTGLIPAGASTFHFTHPEAFPRDFHLLTPALAIFSDIYRHRIVSGDRENSYTITHVLRDDPLVREHFGHYTMTGVLITPIAEDSVAALHHLAIRQAAETQSSEHYAIDCTVAASFPPGGSVVSTVMTSQPIHNPSPG